MEMTQLFLRIAPDRIGYLRFLLEGYDGLAILTTIDSGNGLVRLAVPRARYTEVMLLLKNQSGKLTVYLHA
jgi:hypothetical protein